MDQKYALRQYVWIIDLGRSEWKIVEGIITSAAIPSACNQSSIANAIPAYRIRGLTGHFPQWAVFPTKEEAELMLKHWLTLSYDVIVRRWGGGFPTLRQASVWTGKDHAKTWLTNVTHHYNKQ